MLVQNSLVHMADQEIRRLILIGELAPGERVFEARLSARLGVSRPPLREAMRMLAAQGILEQTPRHGYRVVTLSEQDVEEIYTLRARLEQFAFELAIPSLADDRLVPLETIMTTMWQAARVGDESELLRANREFHLTLVALAGHERLTRAYTMVFDQAMLCMSSNLRGEAKASGGLTDGCRRHELLLDAVRTRNLDRILAALASHGERDFLSPRDLVPEQRDS